MPGMLPVINEECVRQAVRTGLGLKAQINKRSVFDRKNYFYPDLPQGYQISQYKDPIVGEGKIVISLGPDRQGQFEDIEIGIERLHLEQDAGKSMHDQHPTMSYVDLNRSGVALMEIVSKPDMRSSDEAKAYMTKLRSDRALPRHLRRQHGRRLDARRRQRLGAQARRASSARAARSRTSTPSASSARRSNMKPAARSAFWKTAARSIRRRGSSTRARARRARCAPRKMRTTIAISPIRTCCRSNSTQAFVEALRADLPELPDDKKERFVRDLGLSIYDASVLVSEKAIADYFEQVAEGRDGKTAANWVINDLLGALNRSRQGHRADARFRRPSSAPSSI